MNRFFTGIDPGLEGAIATLDVNGPLSMEVLDIPLSTEKGKRYYDLVAMSDICCGLKEKQAIVCVEQQQAMPKQGVASQFSIGYGYGIWIGMLSALRIRYFAVRPRTWQVTTLSGQSGDGKSRALLRCEQLFPEVELFSQGRRGKKKALYGRSDAAMIAYHCYLSFGGVQ